MARFVVDCVRNKLRANVKFAIDNEKIKAEKDYQKYFQIYFFLSLEFDLR